jgi:hypothetical protein
MRQRGRFGAVAFVHRFGSYLWNESSLGDGDWLGKRPMAP